MAVVINGTSGVTTPGVTNSEGYSGDGLTIAAGAPAGAVTVDTSGNLGLGVTPSAWTGVVRAVQLGDTGNYLAAGTVAYSADQYLWLGNNGYFNVTNWVYSRTNPAAQYRQFEGVHTWYTAPSGTAGNAITFTQAMTLDASGNLLVGTTSSAGTAAARMFLSKGGTTWQVGPGTSGSGNNFWVLNSSDIGVYVASGGTSWTANSDERLKTPLSPFKDAVAKVCTLRSGTGRYLTDSEDVSRSFLIAQDVQKVLPEAVVVQDDAQGTLGLSYTDMIPLLTAAIQEQQAIIETLTSRIAALETK